MQPRILLRPAGTSGVYYSAHNLTQRPVDLEIPPASSLVNFPPAYTKGSESRFVLSNTNNISYYELAKQRNDDILQRYMAEAIADNKRAMAAAGLLELEDKSNPRVQEPMPSSPSPLSVRSSETEAPHVMETILHLSKSVPRESSIDISHPITSISNALPPSSFDNNNNTQSTLPEHQISSTASVAPLAANMPNSNDIMKQEPFSSNDVSQEKIHKVPTSSAEIFTELLKAKRPKKSRSSSKRREDRDKLLEIAARNAQLSQTFTQSILNLEHLTQKEKELHQYAHFATVLQNERAQSDQREQAQAQAIQLLLKRIADLEHLTGQQQTINLAHPHIQIPPQQHYAMPGIPSNATAPSYPVPSYLPAQPAQICPNTVPYLPHHPSYTPRIVPCYPHEQVLHNSGVYPGAMSIPIDQSTAHLSHSNTSVIRTSQTPNADESTKTPLSKSVFRMDRSEIIMNSQPPSIGETARGQEISANVSELPVNDDCIDDITGYKRTRFRAKVFTSIPPNPPPFPIDDKDDAMTAPALNTPHQGKLSDESPDFSPPIIRSINVVKLPPRPAKNSVRVPTSVSDNLFNITQDDVKIAEITMPSPINKSMSVSADKDISLILPQSTVPVSCSSNVPKNLLQNNTTGLTSEQFGDWIKSSMNSVPEPDNKTVEHSLTDESLYEKNRNSSTSAIDYVSKLVEQPEEEVTTNNVPEICPDQHQQCNSVRNGQNNLKLYRPIDESTSKLTSSGSIPGENPLAPDIEYDSKIPYLRDQLQEADSPHALQLAYDREPAKDSGNSTSKSQKGRRIKFMDYSSSSSGVLSSASKASTVSVETVEYDEEEYKNTLRLVQSSNTTGTHMTLHDSSSSFDTQSNIPTRPRLGSNLNITGISPAFPSSLSPRSLEQKSSAIKSGASCIVNEQSVEKAESFSQSSSSSLKLQNLNTEPKTPSFGISYQTVPPQMKEPHNSEDIVSDFADLELELELQRDSVISSTNQTLGTMNSLIENASNQASIFKRSLEEALRRSHDASLVADKVSTVSSDQNEISIKKDQILRRSIEHDEYLDLEDYESNFSTDKGCDSLHDDISRRSRTSDVCAAKAPLTATALLSTIQRGINAMSISSRHSMNSAQNSLLVQSTESPRDYKLFLPNDSSIIGYQPEFVPPEDEYIVGDPELFPSHSLDDIEGSVPSIQEPDRIVAQEDIHDDVDLDTPKDGGSEDLSTHSGQYLFSADAPYTSLNTVGSSPGTHELLDNSIKEAIVFNMKRVGMGTSASLASSSSIPSPKRTLVSNQIHELSRGLGFGTGQRKVYGVGTTSSVPTLPATQTSNDRTSSSDDFNVASLSSRTESTSPLKPTQVSKVYATMLSYKSLTRGTDSINPIASESEPSPNDKHISNTRELCSQLHNMTITDVTDHMQFNLDEELDTIPDLDLLGSLSYIPDLNSTSVGEEKLLKDHSTGSSHTQTKFSVNVDVDGFEKFYELDVDLGGDGSEFDDL